MFKQWNNVTMQTNHNALKECAKQLLEQMGFTKDEIQEEYPIKSNQMRESFRVDVVGLKSNRKIAIECGFTNSEKLIGLKLFFDEVIVLPFFKLDTDAVSLQSQIRQLENELAENVRDFEDEKEKHKREIQEALLGANDLEVLNTLIENLFARIEGKQRLALTGWDYSLGNALDSLFNSVCRWRDAYKPLTSKSPVQETKAKF